MEKIREFVNKTVKEKETDHVEEVLLDGRVKITMSVSFDEPAPSGVWSVKIKNLLPENKELKDYNSIDQMAEDIGVENKFEKVGYGFGFIDNDLLQIEEELNNIIDGNFGLSAYEPQIDQPEDSVYDLEFHDSFIIFTEE